MSLLGGSAGALELFGVDLETSQRDALRSAAKKAGVVLIRQGGNDRWFDSYDSSAVLPLSQRLYLGFVKQDKRFAFAEYEFAGFRHPQILRNLSAKYGPPKIINGKYLSDKNYRWEQDGIEIRLNIDWRNYRTRLSYIEPVAFAALKKEQLASNRKATKASPTPGYSVY